MYADDGIWANKTPYSWKSNPGYLYTPKGIDNGEYTVLIRPHGQLHTHESAAWKLAGRDDDSIRSVFEINGADGEHSQPRANWNYAHFPYVHAPVQVAPSFGKLTADKWYGLKAVRIVDPSKKFTDYYLFDDPDPVDSNGNLKNNWRLIAHAHDAGTSEYGNIPSTWKSQRDTFRTDGFQSWDFAKMSVREIDTSAKPAIPLNTLLHQNAFVAQGLENDDNLDSVEEAAAASTSTASQTPPQELGYNNNTQNNFSLSSPTTSTASSLQSRSPTLPPVANAGVSQIADANANVVLDGKNSYVPMMQQQQQQSSTNSRVIIAYQWTQLPIGVPVNMTGASTPTPMFKAPMLPHDTTLAFSLRVKASDGSVSSNPAVAYVKIKHSQSNNNYEQQMQLQQQQQQSQSPPLMQQIPRQLPSISQGVEPPSSLFLH
jgi:hypothetical protein